MTSQNNFNIAFWSRLTCFCLATFGYIWYFQVKGSYHALVKYFSMHAYFFFWAYYFLNVVELFKPFNEKWTSIKHLLLKLGLPLNAMISLAFFALLRPRMNDEPWLDVKCCEFTHSVPLIILVIEYCLNSSINYTFWEDVRMIRWYLVASLSINLMYTFLDEPVYYFVTYYNVSTYVFITCFALFFLSMYLLTYFINTQRVKQESITDHSFESKVLFTETSSA